LGFLATIHWDEANCFHGKLGIPYTPIKEASLRCTMEEVAAFADAFVSGAAGLLLLLTICRLGRLHSVRPAFRLAGGLFLFTAAAMFFAAFGVPRVGSPHDDMFAGLGFFISSAPVLLMSGCSFLIARLLGTLPTESGI
jgi:hypothetical protein